LIYQPSVKKRESVREREREREVHSESGQK
jgi:hypothetical protein